VPFVLVLCGAFKVGAFELESPPTVYEGFRAGPIGNEQVRTLFIDPGVRVVMNLPAPLQTGRPTLLITYAVPNGNTIEQTMGGSIAPGLDWHFDI